MNERITKPEFNRLIENYEKFAEVHELEDKFLKDKDGKYGA